MIDKAKENGVVLVIFPPHTNHKLQPLDKTVNGPLKTFFNTSCNYWQLSNPGKPITIYEIAQCLGKSYPRAFTSQNITVGFRASGIYPYDSNIFSDRDFLSSYVTDRNISDEATPTQELTVDEPIIQPIPVHQPNQSVSRDQPQLSQPESIQSTSGCRPALRNISQPESTKAHLEQHSVITNPEAPQGPTAQSSDDEQSPDKQEQQDWNDYPMCTQYWSPQDLRPYPKAKARKSEGKKQTKNTLH